MPLVLLDLLLTLTICASLWRAFSYFFWCDKCQGFSISGNVERFGAYLCRTHNFEAIEAMKVVPLSTGKK